MDHESTHVEEDRIRRVYDARTDRGRYSWLTRGQQLIVQGAERGLLGALRRTGLRTLDESTFLEIGCGSGHWLRALVQWGARPDRVVGVDLIASRLVEAQTRSARDVRLAAASGVSLPFRQASFDVVLQSTVFTSILDGDVRRAVAAEMLRVLRPKGLVLWYDFFVDNPRNRDVRGVSKAELKSLFAGCNILIRRVTLAPPLARALAPRIWPLAAALSSIPILCTHYVGTISRPK
ncbi:MAG TPA: class I SAM-dependent methyltransferase [Gemmatimonadaceae bacterium]|nr:class I SAM-dependent methyltransferase [Gemmatimonadaceae bacterium]